MEFVVVALPTAIAEILSHAFQAYALTTHRVVAITIRIAIRQYATLTPIPGTRAAAKILAAPPTATAPMTAATACAAAPAGFPVVQGRVAGVIVIALEAYPVSMVNVVALVTAYPMTIVPAV
jgi:hypothetical protein